MDQGTIMHDRTSHSLVDTSGVRVVVRIRPLNEREKSIGKPNSCLVVDPNGRYVQILTKPVSQTFTYDYVAGEETTQKMMFETVGKPIVDSCMSGYNGTIFCYGQTGSGKTYTMTGIHNDKVKRGLIPRIFDYLYDSIEKLKKAKGIEFLCQCSFLEIYNDQVSDLLDYNPNTFLQLREDVKKGVYVENLSIKTVTSAEDAYSVLTKGLLNRHTGATEVNRESSRSHSVFTMFIQSTEKSPSGLTKTRTAKLNLIDLAGSERQKYTKSEGERLKEACKINESLSALGNVIMALVDIANGKQRYVHYRDSKLTFLLRDSLGGNSKTCIVANCSPSFTCLPETLSTLKFAQRAKYIRNQPIVNEDTSGDINALQEEIRALKAQLAKANAIINGPQRVLLKRVSNITPNTLIDVREQTPEDLSRVAQLEKLLAETIKHKKKTDEEYQQKYDALSQKVEKLNELYKRQRFLNEAIKFNLRLREYHLAKAQGRKPHLYLKRSEKEEQEDMDKARQLIQLALSPDYHPSNIHLAVENLDLREQVEEYQLQYGELSEAPLTEMKMYCEQLSAQIAEVVTEKHLLQQQLDELKESANIENSAKYKELEEQLQMLRMKLLEAKKEIEARKAREKHLWETGMAMKKRLEKYEILERAYDSSKKDLNEQAEELRRLRESVSENEELKSQIAKLKEELEKKATEGTTSEQALNSIKQEYENQIQQIVAKYDELKQQSEHSHSEMLKREQDLTDKLQKIQTQHDVVTKEHETLKQQYMEAQKEISMLKESEKQLKESKLEVDEQLKKSNSSLQELQKLYDSAQNELNDLRKEIQRLKIEEQKHNQLIQNQASSNKELHEKNTALSRELILLKEQLNVQEKTLQEADQRSAKAKEQLEALQAQIQTLSNDKFNLAKQHELLLAEKENLSTKLTSLQNQQQNVTSKYMKELESKNEEVMKLQRELKKAHQNAEQLHAELKFQKENAEQQIELLMGQLADANCKLHDTEEKLFLSQQSPQPDPATTEELKQAKLELEKQKQYYQNTLKEMDNRISKMQSRNQELTQLIDTLESDKRNLTQKIQELEKMLKQVPSYKDKIMELESIIRLNKSVNELEDKKEKLQQQLISEKQQFSKKLHEVELENKRLRHQLEEQIESEKILKQINEELMERNKKLEAQNAKLIGHQNPKQKIQHHIKIKEENNQLKKQKQELEKLLKEKSRTTARLATELQKIREHLENKENLRPQDQLSSVKEILDSIESGSINQLHKIAS